MKNILNEMISEATQTILGPIAKPVIENLFG